MYQAAGPVAIMLSLPVGPAIAQQAPAPTTVLITEVLYAVPKGDAGDASKDGSRHATGDEFVEIYNPTDRPVRLAGWSITDRNAPDAGQFLFVFPEFTLGPGETAVLFNGLDQSIPGPVGDAQAPPPATNDRFDNAWVFTAGNTSSTVGFANTADWVCLRDAGKQVVECCVWGDPDETPPVADARLVKLPRTSAASVQRTLAGPAGVFEVHPDAAGLRCSPGTPPPPQTKAAAGKPGG